MRLLELMDFTSGNSLCGGAITFAKKTNIDLDNLEDIRSIEISVVSGDEVADITYTNGKKRRIDSSVTRMINFYDGCYTLYNKETGENRIEEFLKRKSSYTMFDTDYEAEKDDE